jgi:predicted ABC-type ATPase
MMKTVDNRMKAIGEELGNAIDNLPNATIDMRPAQQQVLKMLEDNGIIITKEPSGRIRYQWDTGGPSAYTPEQQAYIQQAVDTMLKFDQLNSRGVYNGDRFFGNLINQFYADKNMRGLFVNINGVDKAFLPMMRELYRSPLDNITQGGISALNKQYSQYRRLVDAANETLYNAGKDLGIPIDIGAPLQTNLRRIFSNAKSRSQFSAVLNELDRVARENGYVGPDLKSMSKFDLYVQSLYPDEAIPRGSFAGQIRAGMGGGLLSKVERFLSSGEPNINDQRNALKGLLNADIPRTPDVPPSTTAVPPTKAPSPTKGSQTSASPNDTTPNLINEKEQATKVAREIVGKSTATKGRVADIVLGPPASGKNAVFSDRLLTERNALLLDADEVKKMLPGYDGGKGAAATHEASSNILEKTLIQEAAIKGDNIVLPMVGKTQAKIENLITLLKGRGYTVNLHLAEIPVETSVARAQARAAKTGRVVPEDYLRSIGDKPTQTFDGIVNNPKMKAMLNEYNKYSNDVPMGTSPKVLDTSSPSFVFVSPSTEVGLTYDQAKQALKTPLQKQSHEMMQDIINQRKIPGNIEDAIGKWSDGAENTLVFKDGNLTREQLRLLGAEGAMPMRQKQYIWFKHNPKGADYVQELAVSGKVTVEQLKDALTKNGVQFMTVGKDRVYIFNKAGDYFDAELPKKISTTYKELGLDRGGRKGYRGDGEFEGSWAEGEGARDEAQGIYKQIIDNGGK